MKINRLQRRQLLGYFGLGIVGAGATALLLQRNTRSSLPEQTTSLADVPAPSNPSSLPEPMHLPEFQGISQWLNSEPLTIADLRGNVVLIQFWTFACINCIRTLPYVVGWHQQYAEQGLRVIGVHSPEFAFEREVSNIQSALTEHQITYPVPLDNEFKTWKAYKNRFWPHLFLADRDGILRYDHIGEGAYEETEQTIRRLLG
ncbi:MAG: thioredoxin family protein [Oculatellaceae cyanobacterium bins.114]|nr:thioredoxin family protein [Oculatellaceae cyanobacterium bins.114]